MKAVRSGNRPGSNNPKPKCHRLVHSGRTTGVDTSVPFVFIKKNHNSANSQYNSASYHFEPAVRRTSTSAGVRQSQSEAHNELSRTSLTTPLAALPTPLPSSHVPLPPYFHKDRPVQSSNPPAHRGRMGGPWCHVSPGSEALGIESISSHS